MSSINEHYTFEYLQPEEYRLSHDSVFLARQIFEKTRSMDFSSVKALDLCAGAGVVGMDFLFHRRANRLSLPSRFDFLDVQEVYAPYFAENEKRLGPVATEISFLVKNYNDLQKKEFEKTYDLILSAPPYFLPTQGKLSPSQFKNRCRFFIDSDLKNLFLGIHHCLKASGMAFLLLRDLPDHGYDVIQEAKNICQGLLKFEVLGDIRGTHFVQLTSCALPAVETTFTSSRPNVP